MPVDPEELHRSRAHRRRTPSPAHSEIRWVASETQVILAQVHQASSLGTNKSSCFSKNGSCSLYGVPYAAPSCVELKAENEKEVVNCVPIKPEEIFWSEWSIEKMGRTEEQGLVNGYRVKYFTKSNDSLKYTKNTSDDNATLNLTKEAYVISVTAFNEAGESPEAILKIPPINEEKEMDHEKIVFIKALALEEQMFLEWEPSNVEINNYIVECEKDKPSKPKRSTRSGKDWEEGDDLIPRKHRGEDGGEKAAKRKHLELQDDSVHRTSSSKRAWLTSPQVSHQERPSKLAKTPPASFSSGLPDEPLVPEPLSSPVRVESKSEGEIVDIDPPSLTPHQLQQPSVPSPQDGSHALVWGQQSVPIPLGLEANRLGSQLMDPRHDQLISRYPDLRFQDGSYLLPVDLSQLTVGSQHSPTPPSPPPRQASLFHHGPLPRSPASSFISVPAEGPSAEEVENIDKNQATIKWKEIPEGKRNGFITNYTVFYKAEDGKEFGETVDSSVLQYRLKFLQANTKYTAHVMASTIAGGKNGTATTFITSKFSVVDIILINAIVGMFMLCLLIIGILGAVKRHMLKDAFWPKIPHPHIMTTVVTMDQMAAVGLGQSTRDIPSYCTNTPSSHYFPPCNYLPLTLGKNERGLVAAVLGGHGSQLIRFLSDVND
ncbi:hypothetical protein JD844_008545 [Phrynosoma platyrhinos]|uniref:Fibronectin type-III domain-containing protein n=1 Tax=Phrynosoma platyrhinos TaxID=52577 RepID=A0ABQ7TEL3_PHRPL|nr:hypothetical protein JD844_008545 [Phrynosoma platyrhinos]